jgi:hypothetical protein
VAHRVDELLFGSHLYRDGIIGIDNVACLIQVDRTGDDRQDQNLHTSTYSGRRHHPPTTVGNENTAFADTKASPSRGSSVSRRISSSVATPDSLSRLSLRAQRRPGKPLRAGFSAASRPATRRSRCHENPPARRARENASRRTRRRVRIRSPALVHSITREYSSTSGSACAPAAS